MLYLQCRHKILKISLRGASSLAHMGAAEAKMKLYGVIAK